MWCIVYIRIFSNPVLMKLHLSDIVVGRKPLIKNYMIMLNWLLTLGEAVHAVFRAGRLRLRGQNDRAIQVS